MSRLALSLLAVHLSVMLVFCGEARAAPCSTHGSGGDALLAGSPGDLDTSDMTFRGHPADGCSGLYQGNNSAAEVRTVAAQLGSILDPLQPQLKAEGAGSAATILYGGMRWTLAYETGPEPNLWTLSYSSDPDVLGYYDVIAAVKQATGWAVFRFANERFAGDGTGVGTFFIDWCGGSRSMRFDCSSDALSHMSVYFSRTVFEPATAWLLGLALLVLAALESWRPSTRFTSCRAVRSNALYSLGGAYRAYVRAPLRRSTRSRETHMTKLRAWSVSALVLLTVALASQTAHGAVVFTTDAAAWIAAHPGAALEDFENANLAPGTADAFTGPLNASTDNSIFAAGSVIGGFSLSAVPPSGLDIYVERDFGGNSGVLVASNFFAADINIDFAPNVYGIGIDLGVWIGNVGVYGLEVYDAANNLLGSFSSGPGFVGIDSTDAIARLFIDKPDIGGVIDNLRFDVLAVPEPATLLLLALSLAGLGAAVRRQGTA